MRHFCASSSGGAAPMKTDQVATRESASFRDPAGFVEYVDGRVFRRIAPHSRARVESFLRSPVSARLVAENRLIGFGSVVEAAADASDTSWPSVEVQRIPTISYPCEWTFGQLRDAALLTLDVHLAALEQGFGLKDASAYNVQFRGTEPVFIDLFSFEPSDGRRYWVAYRQFCEHFLGPLALMSTLGNALPNVLFANIEGLTVPRASRLLPLRTWCSPSLLMHLHAHALACRHAGDGRSARPSGPERRGFQVELGRSLRSAVQGLRAPRLTSEWTDYRCDNTYDEGDAQRKAAFVELALARSGARSAADLGSNDGHHSSRLAAMGLRVVSLERDRACCERQYAAMKEGHRDVLTLAVDLTNPTPGFGWAGRERRPLSDRLNVDAIVALALVHHLVLRGGVSLAMIAQYIAELGRCAVVEFVPPSDPMARALAQSRPDLREADVEAQLGHDAFQAAFRSRFAITDRAELAGGRVLYSMERLV